MPLVALLRADFPDAIYTSPKMLAAALKHARPLANPVIPPTRIAAPRGRTAAQKMAIKEGMRVAVIDPPPDYARALGPLPTGAVFEEDPDEVAPVTLWFVRDLDALQSGLRRMRDRVPETK